MRKLILGLGFISVLASCSSDIPEIHLDQPTMSSTSPYKIDEATSVKIALLGMQSISNNPTTRSASDRKVKSISVITPQHEATRSQEIPDTLLYVINFENNGGFAIVSADKRALPLYAVSDTGEFLIAEDSNPAVKETLNGIVMDASDRIGRFINPDSLIIHPNLPDPITQMYGFKLKYGPYISAHQSTVHSSDQYCKYITNTKGEPALSGCVAVAVEIFMSFHQWPQSADGYDFNWSEMNNGNDDDGIARLLYVIGQPQYLRLSYKNMETLAGANHTRIPTALKDLGYTVTGSFISFFNNETQVRKILTKEPIIMQSFTTHPDWGGHAWVIDGYAVFHNLETEGDLFLPNKYYYHCVWGDRGNNNGYYYVADTKGFIGSPDLLGKGDNGNTDYSEFHQHDESVVFLSGVSPNK